MKKIIFIFLLSLLEYISCKSKEEWKSRSIYQLITDRFSRTSDTGRCDLNSYCGGNYQGIIKKLDYIKGMGFDAIWISPIVENMEGSYHGYHFTNLYALNNHFGSEEDFKALISACHKKDIWIMVDVEVNHVAPVGTNYSLITPFDSAEYYHDECLISDWKNQFIVENCRLCDLPDLKQENEWVTEKLVEWIHDLVIKYDIDGIRIATVNEVPKWFWDKFTISAGVFQIGEVFDGDPDYLADYQNHLDSVHNYPLFYCIRNIFDDNYGTFESLEQYFYNIRPKFPSIEYTATFIENHDNPRFLYNNLNKVKYTNAVILTLLWEGIPIFYYGGEQYYKGGQDPYNREPLWDNYDTDSPLYKILGKINGIRKKYSIWDFPIVQNFADKQFYAFSRGDIFACFSITYGVERHIVHHNYENGDKFCNILDDEKEDCITVSDGILNVIMEEYPKIYIKQ